MTSSVLPPRADGSGTVTHDQLCQPGGEILTDRKGRLVVRHGAVVVKTHMAGEAAGPLLTRLRLAADPALSPPLLPPLRIQDADGGLLATVGGRLVSAWPAASALRVDDVDSDLAAAPWEAAAGLIARLHATDLTGGSDRSGHADHADRVDQGEAAGRAAAPVPVPPAGCCVRLRRAMTRMEDALATVGASDRSHRLADDVRRACAALPAWLGRSPVRPGGPVTLIHGDWHLGQVVWTTPPSSPVPPGTGTRPDSGLRIIDIDDLGWGEPAWDLARPAAWFAAGLLPTALWSRFLDAYLAAGGVLGPDPDPWAALDGPAQAVTVQYAAGAVADHVLDGTPLDDGARAFLTCARRIAALG